MEIETLLVATKWDVLRVIANKPHSPMQLAEKLNTTIANISTQLRLLEAANLVSKVRTGQSKAGKPRNLYSLSKEYVHVTAFGQGIAYKELIPLRPFSKTTILAWSLPKQYQGVLLKFLYQHEYLFKRDVFVQLSKNTIILEVLDATQKPMNETVLFEEKSFQITLKGNKNAKKTADNMQICYGDTQ